MKTKKRKEKKDKKDNDRFNWTGVFGQINDNVQALIDRPRTAKQKAKQYQEQKYFALNYNRQSIFAY